MNITFIVQSFSSKNRYLFEDLTKNIFSNGSANHRSEHDCHVFPIYEQGLQAAFWGTLTNKRPAETPLESDQAALFVAVMYTRLKFLYRSETYKWTQIHDNKQHKCLTIQLNSTMMIILWSYSISHIIVCLQKMPVTWCGTAGSAPEDLSRWRHYSRSCLAGAEPGGVWFHESDRFLGGTNLNKPSGVFLNVKLSKNVWNVRYVIKTFRICKVIDNCLAKFPVSRCFQVKVFKFQLTHPKEVSKRPVLDLKLVSDASYAQDIDFPKLTTLDRTKGSAKPQAFFFWDLFLKGWISF